MSLVAFCLPTRYGTVSRRSLYLLSDFHECPLGIEFTIQRNSRPDPDNRFRPNQWALDGTWRISGESARLEGPNGAIQFRFEAPKLNLVMAGGADGTKAVTGRVYLDGKPVPPASRGADVKPDGTVTVRASRLYNLIALSPGDDAPHLFELRFDRPEVELFAFTFG